MTSKLIEKILKNKNNSIMDATEFEKLEEIVNDSDYLTFLRKTNGGVLFEGALHFYGVLPNPLGSDLFFNTYLFKKYYEKLIEIQLTFGEDAFGNQYVFLNDNRIAFVNIETGEVDALFHNFNHFVKELFNDSDYYSGFSIFSEWVNQNGKISEFKRLCPKKPFVIGGTYDIKNFYVLEKEKLLDYNSYIAYQIRNLPEGTLIQLKST